MNEQEYFKIIGQEAQTSRKATGLTQDEVCEKLKSEYGITLYRQDLSAFEKHGRKIQSAYVINRLFAVLGVTLPDPRTPEKKTTLLSSSTRLCPA
jgi:transcriptional regulator with XRE-family HTH domain